MVRCRVQPAVTLHPVFLNVNQLQQSVRFSSTDVNLFQKKSLNCSWMYATLRLWPPKCEVVQKKQQHFSVMNHDDTRLHPSTGFLPGFSNKRIFRKKHWNFSLAVEMTLLVCLFFKAHLFCFTEMLLLLTRILTDAPKNSRLCTVWEQMESGLKKRWRRKGKEKNERMNQWKTAES